MAEAGSVDEALRAFVEAVRQKRFPAPEHAWR
jgi:ketopantoate hydroxymethyltransferase